jgi:hypothetical protein
VRFGFYKTLRPIQGESDAKVNVLRGDSIGHCEKNDRMNVCLIVNGYGDRAV